MKANHNVVLAAVAVSMCAASSASACYKHTFDKCEGGVQVADLRPANSQATKPQSAASSPASGWVTTVTISR